MKGLCLCVVTDEDVARDYGCCKSWRKAQTHVRQTVVWDPRRLGVVKRVRNVVCGGGRGGRGGGDGQRGTLSGVFHLVPREQVEDLRPARLESE